MWKRNQLHILTVATTLSSAAFCLHMVPTKPQERVIRHGTIFVGNQRKLFSNETKGGAGALGDTDGYQADQPEAEVGYQLAELKLHQLRPSVQCDNDSMTLRMLGKRVPDFLVERDGKSPVPLSELPADCGLSVKRARRDIFLVAKYDGCHMTQEGDNYILPLRLWGVPVKMGCPVEALFLTVSCTLSAMVIQVGNSVDSLKVKVNGEWQPLAQACDTCGFTLEAVPSEWIVTAPYTSKCWQIEGEKRLLSVLYSNGEVTLSCPLDTTPLPTDEELPPVPPIPPMEYPFPYPGNQFWPFYLGYPGTPPRSPTTATTTGTSPTAPAATVTPPSADEHFWNPYGHGRNWLFYPGYPGYSEPPLRSPISGPATSAPTTTTATTTNNPTTAATTAKPSFADERFWNRYGHGRNWLFYPGYPGYSGPPPKSATPASATPAPTTTSATTTTNPTTSAATAKPPGADERFWNPYGHARNWLFYPGYPGYSGPPPRSPTPVPTTPAPTTTSATTTTNPTTAATTAKPLGSNERFWYPYGHARNWLLYPGYPGYSGPPPRSPTPGPTTPGPETPDPTTATTTTIPTTAATTAKPLGSDERFWNPYGYPKHWLYYPSYPSAYGYTGAPPRNPATTVTNPAPTATTSPTTAATIGKPPGADERFWNPYGHANYWRFYPGARPMIPTTTAPTSTATASSTSTVKPPPNADQQQHWSPLPWLPTTYDPSVYSNTGQAYQIPWMPYPPRHSGKDQKGLLPVATASVVNGAASVRPKWYYPTYQMPGAPQLQTSAATRHTHHQGMPHPYSWPMYPSSSRQSLKDTGIDPKLNFDQMFASRGWSSLLYPAQISPLQVKAGQVYKGSDLVPSR